MNRDTIKIFNVEIDRLTNESFIDYFKEAIGKNEKRLIGYANADTLNKIFDDNDLSKIFQGFDLVHPDGTGVYLAGRLLYGNRGLENKLTGSDFYPFLIKESIRNRWKIFFFGHTDEILSEIQRVHPNLIISGSNEGYNYETSGVINKINEQNPDIVIIGLSCPNQERWMNENKDKINFKVMIAVGDGIKVFAGKKDRGPVILQKMGMEWLVRLMRNPVANFNKYALGVPLFVSRIFKAKIKAN